jgi:hypothetical protein
VSQLIASLLVPALAIAVNPVPIIAAVTLLASDHGKRNAAVFLGTLVAVMLAVGVLTIFLIGKSSSSQQSAGKGMAAIQLLFGIVFLVTFVVQWRNKQPDGDPGWLKMMDRAGFIVGVVLGLALTNYALLTAGTTAIRKSGLSATNEAIALIFFVVLSVSTVIAPLVIYLVSPAWAEDKLGRLKAWLTKHSRVILMVVFGLMGLLFTALGLSPLLQ